MIEEWRPIVGYEGLYEVSSYGRVRSLDRYDNRNCFRKGKVLSPAKDKNGYLKVVLNCNGKCKTTNVHRLVAQAFLTNPDNLPQVNHKNDDKSDNRVENLEMCNAKYNLSYGTARIRERDTKMKNGWWTGLSKEEWRKKYKEKNREKIKEYMKEYSHSYYQENKDRICEQQKKYNQENKDKIKDRDRTYYQKNREKILMQKKEYYRKKKEYIQNNV